MNANDGWRAGFAGLSLLALAACAQAPAPTLSVLATFAVDSRADAPDARPGDGRCAAAAGACTLRAAIGEANALAGVDAVNVPAGVYALTLGELVITDSLTLNGVNDNALFGSGQRTAIDGGGRSRVVVVRRAKTTPAVFAVALNRLTVRNGDNPSPGVGAGVVVDWHSRVELDRVTVHDNRSRVYGAGITNFGDLTVSRSTVANNRMPTTGGGGVTNSGGGIYNAGSLIVRDSAVYDNEATRGGGVATTLGSWTILENTTVSGNRAAARGGGIFNEGSLGLNSSTVTRNQAFAFRRGPGGGEDFFGGGVYNRAGTLVLFGSILAENEANLSRAVPGFAPDCYSLRSARVVSEGGNLVGVVNGDCAIVSAGERTPSVTGTAASPASPMLNALAPNGGPTLTHALTPYSRAKELAGSVGGGAGFVCPGGDQRRQRRPFDGNGDGTAACDAGAFEARSAPPRDLTPPTCTAAPGAFRPTEEVDFTFRDEPGGSGVYRVTTSAFNATVSPLRGVGGAPSASMTVYRTDPRRPPGVVLVTVEDAAGNRAFCWSDVPIG